MEVRAVEITASAVGDAPMLPGLLSQIPTDEPIASGEPASADGACDGVRRRSRTGGDHRLTCREAIADRGADAIIPPRRNAKPRKKDGPGAGARNEALRAIKRFGRTLCRKCSDHHRRSRVESKMNRMKLLGQRLAARDFDRQTAELQVRVAILNRFTALGIPITQPVG
jgi:hypothetical protein